MKRKTKAELEAARRAVFFLENLAHVKGQWAGQQFKLLGWQHKLISDVFGTLRSDGCRQYQTVYCEIPKKNGKSELAAGIALDLTFADGEPGAEVYSAAADRDQAGIVYKVAEHMVRQSRELQSRCDILSSTKTIFVPATNSTYKAISSESYTKHGYNISGVVFDELHTQPNRDLYDVLTKGSSAARRNPLFVFITTAGNNINSICYELHDYARKVLAGDIIDPTFYPIMYGLEPEDDWTDEKNWYKVNPSLGEILNIEEFRKSFLDAKRNLAEENIFKQLRLNIWVKQSTRWMRMGDWDVCGKPFDMEELKGKPCYAGLDLSSSIDLTALSLVFPDGERYRTIMRFWIPEATAEERERKDRVPYREWARQGFIKLTPGNVVDYAYIREEFKKLREQYQIREMAYDRWGAAKLIQDLIEDGFVTDQKDAADGHPLIVEFGQGMKSMSPPTKELMVLVLSNKLEHGGNPVLRWCVDNLVIEQDAAENIKPNKAKSTQRIDGAVSMIMAIDRAIKNNQEPRSVYEDRGVIVI
jgi:phage terminase large subunit-like protein